MRLVLVVFQPWHSRLQLQLLGCFPSLDQAREMARQEGAGKEVAAFALGTDDFCRDFPMMPLVGNAPALCEEYKRESWPGRENGSLYVMEFEA